MAGVPVPQGRRVMVFPVCETHRLNRIPTSSHSALSKLRSIFLETEGRGSPDYWSSEEILTLYDSTLARRIGWKWDAVLEELEQRSLRDHLERCQSVVDWGTGSGVAVERLLEAIPALRTRPIELRDRSAQALRFSAAKMRTLHAELRLSTSQEVFAPLPPNSLLLVSHVLSELPDDVRSRLTTLAAGAEAVLWVEGGTHFISHALVAVREALRATHLPLAPCLHANRCGLFAPERSHDWCHSFVKPPAEVFTDGDWARLGRELKIDLRSLPVSFLFAAKEARPSKTDDLTPSILLGRAKIHKGGAQCVACTPVGIIDRRIDSRKERSLIKEIESNPFYCQMALADQH
jgi:hypothetical protein